MVKPEKISITIAAVCQKHGIIYDHPDPKIAILIKDAQRLGEIKLELKIMQGDLKEIAERHEIDGLAKLLTDDIRVLNNIDHDIHNIEVKISAERKEIEGTKSNGTA
jgi:hypothetical protein